MWPLKKATLVLDKATPWLTYMRSNATGKCSVAVNERNCVLDCFEEQVGFFLSA